MSDPVPEGAEAPAEDDDGPPPAGCGGCMFAIVLIGVGALLGWLDTRNQRNLDVYVAERGQTFDIDILSDLETAKGCTRVHDLRATLKLEGLPGRELSCVSTGDSDFSELKELDAVSFKGIPINSINVDSTFKFAADVPDDAALDGMQGELVFTAKVEYYYLDLGERLVGSATGSAKLDHKTYDLESKVPLRVVPPGKRVKQARALDTASSLCVLLAVILGVISGLRFVIGALRAPDPKAASSAAGEQPSAGAEPSAGEDPAPPPPA